MPISDQKFLIQLSGQFPYRLRPIGGIPVDEPSNSNSDGAPKTYLTPRARHDRARSEALFRNASPLRTTGGGFSNGTSKVTFSNEAEMIPSISKNYSTLNSSTIVDNALNKDLYRKWSEICAVNGSHDSSNLSMLRERRGGRGPSRAVSTSSARSSYFHHPSSVVKSSLRSKYSSTFRTHF